MTKTTNIIQIIDSLDAGGAEMMAVNIANNIVGTNLNSYLCVTRHGGILTDKISKNVKTLFLNKKGVVDLKAFFKLYMFIKKNKISIIHAHSSSFFIAIIMKMLNFKLKIFWHDHYGKSEEIQDRPFMLLSICQYFFSGIISVNEILKNWASQKLKHKKVYFLANFADLNIDLKQTELFGIDGYRIVCLAAFRHQKNQLELIKIFNKIHLINPNWTLHLVGNISDANYYTQLQTILKFNKIENSVFIYPACLDVAHVLSQATIGVLNSVSEGLPVALLEYGLVGLSVVVTDVGECKNVVGDYGIVVAKNDNVALFNALLKLINDPILRTNYGIAYQNHIQKNYSKENYMKKIFKIYEIC